MTANEVRQIFLDFFKSKGHSIVPSAPLILKDDPTLMFSNSGMVQFKDYFLGNKVAAAKRIADTQKCLRVSGKHNDLEEVGIDTYHHTLFEMLGNWSFGDYFKQDAIDWAWELLTEIYKLPKDRLYVTIFEGDKKENLDPDNEAKNIWKKHVSEERILNGNKKDNFWEMGDQGPCGPCSEIHFDLRPDNERAQISGDKLVNADHPQVIEIWNLVFMQFNRKADGSLEQLPDKHVDTGMGFERLVRVIEMKHSNYDTDVFAPLLKHLEFASQKTFGKDEKIDIAMRVISDHVRAVAFTIADGELPSNNGAGYVIKRILRRAVRYGYTFLGFTEPFMHDLVPVLSAQFSHIFPEIDAQKDFIKKVIFEEERAFLLTLEKGIKRFDEIKYTLSDTHIPGKLVFELYDTFGFPVDLTELLARESGMSIDKKEFEAAMKEQKDRSRAAAETEKSDWNFIVDHAEANRFLGYEHSEAKAKILRYRQISDKKKSYFQLVLNQTPFYAESGGQVGDKGSLTGENGEKIVVFDTVKENDLIIHLTDKLPSNLTQEFHCQVNTEKRKLTENNHSCTHLLHAALRQVLGTHVMQKGSLVNEEVLRFDFSHFAKMTDEEIAKVESIVNAKIRENITLEEKRNVPISEAKSLGAMALFGEKYGDFVRVITFDKNYSVELCGGTHVKATGQIGLFKIVSESSIAAGVRRIEAVTASKAEEFVAEQAKILSELREMLKNPKDLLKAVSALSEEKAKLQKEIERLQAKEITAVKNELLGKITVKSGVNFLAERVEMPSSEALKTLSFQLKNQTENLFSVLVSEIEGKAHIAVMISENLTEEKSLDAAKIVKDLAALVQGGGGGQKFFATAAGKNPEGIEGVLVKCKGLV